MDTIDSELQWAQRKAFSTPPAVLKRLASMMVDHFAMIFILAAVFLVVALPFIFISTWLPEELDWVVPAFVMLLCLLVFSIYFNKDILHGRSVGKRALELQVVDNDTGNTATPIQCLIRNFSIIIWPAEVIVTVFSPNRRMGDYIAGTRVINYVPQVQKTKLNRSEIIKALLAGFGVMTLFVLISVGMQLLFYPDNLLRALMAL